MFFPQKLSLPGFLSSGCFPLKRCTVRFLLFPSETAPTPLHCCTKVHSQIFCRKRYTIPIFSLWTVHRLDFWLRKKCTIRYLLCKRYAVKIFFLTEGAPSEFLLRKRCTAQLFCCSKSAPAGAFLFCKKKNPAKVFLFPKKCTARFFSLQTMHR